jgi:glycosyltransferase involved in cell wall biosynthesis
MTFSIITINYNERDGLRRTLESVLAQTCHDFEYIIIDGGSTDGSREVINSNADRIDYWVSEPDRGIYHAMNKGTLVAKGEYCIFMNSGDTFYSNDVLEKVMAHNLSSDVVCGDICFGKNNICKNPMQVTMKTFYKHTLYHQASFIRTELLKSTPYDDSMRSAADWKWFMHTLVFENGTYSHLPITIAFFEGGGFSEKQRQIGQEEIEKELRQCLPLRIIEDYEDYCFGKTPYRRMMNGIEIVPPLRNLIFRINLMILKFLNVKWNADWIKKL